jgi:SPP1 gp7 family putative phage head morphogenesis protein
MKKDDWKTTRLLQDSFLDTLSKLTDLFHYIAFSAGDDKEKYINDMRNFQNSEPFNSFVYSAVRRMVTPIAVQNMRTWRMAAKKATKNPSLYRMLMSEINQGLKSDIEIQIEENASLIKTLPTDVAKKVTKDISDMALKGMRASEIAKVIREQTDKHSRASAKLIARTEVSKTTTALTKARCDNLDLHWYVWRTMEDGDRVRKSHRIMEGVLVNWNEPPSPEALAGEKSVGNYHAGNIWNCRCYPEPLIEIDDISWPHKVYTNGKIQTMGKMQFEQMM